MSDKADGKTDGAAAGTPKADESTDPVVLANALRFEKAKNKVLLDEVVALEDEVVNRCMEDFDAVVSDETREFWREQLLSNRDAATAALKEMQRNRVAGADGTRRPLHNRATARPVPGAAGGASASTGQGGDTDDRAAKIRNRAHEISKAERVPFSVAFRRAEKELGNK
ncbi:MAG: hypothetical protein NTV49_14500 [Kiritimatiellaeota bacterium]|nr:hypothetical protein [Kiritimatiellota bacterium]